MAAADKAKFKVGDRVRFTDECPSSWWFGPHTENKEGVIDGQDSTFGYWWSVRVGDRYGHVDDNHIEPASLTIREGRYYRTRDGRKVGPIKETRYSNGAGNPSWPFTVGLQEFWTESGKAYWGNINGEVNSEIISEWVDEPANTAGYTVPLCAYEDDFDICGYREPAGGDGEDDVVQLSVGELTAALADSLKVARKVGKTIKRGDLVVLARPALVTGINVDMRTVSIQTDGGNYSLPMAALTAA